MNTFNQFFFGIYPYICLAVFFLGSLMRFDREQYTWKSDSSELLYRGQLRLGSVLFHVGVLAVFFGHLFGLLTPLQDAHLHGHDLLLHLSVYPHGACVERLCQRLLHRPRMAACAQALTRRVSDGLPAISEVGAV